MNEVRWQHVYTSLRGIHPDDAIDRLARVSATNSNWARERARAAALFLEQDQETESQVESTQTVGTTQDFRVNVTVP